MNDRRDYIFRTIVVGAAAPDRARVEVALERACRYCGRAGSAPRTLRQPLGTARPGREACRVPAYEGRAGAGPNQGARSHTGCIRPNFGPRSSECRSGCAWPCQRVGGSVRRARRIEAICCQGPRGRCTAARRSPSAVQGCRHTLSARPANSWRTRAFTRFGQDCAARVARWFRRGRIDTRPNFWRWHWLVALEARPDHHRPAGTGAGQR